MRKIPLEQPPSDPEALKEWLTRMMVLINGSIDQTQDYETIYEIPSIVFNGMVRLFGAAVAPEIPTKGLYVFQDGSWYSLMSGSIYQGWDPLIQYNEGDFVTIGAYTYRANTDTMEDPTPANVGSPYWLSREGVSALGDNPSWATDSHYAKSIVIGQHHPALDTGFIDQIRISIPQSNIDIKYTIWLIADGEFFNLGVYNGTAVGWIDVNPPQYLSDRVAEITFACEISSLQGTDLSLVYNYIADHFAMSSSKGLLDLVLDGASIVGINIPNGLVDNTLGIDARFQAATTSLDWDVVSQSGGGSSPSAPFVPTTFSGPGTTGYVKDSVVNAGKFLSDTGEFLDTPAGDWDDIANKPILFPPEAHTHSDLSIRVFFQPTQPTDSESSQGDIWFKEGYN